jgi:hypothetical protein
MEDYPGFHVYGHGDMFGYDGDKSQGLEHSYAGMPSRYKIPLALYDHNPGGGGILSVGGDGIGQGSIGVYCNSFELDDICRFRFRK